jgi:hypothetical protein
VEDSSQPPITLERVREVTKIDEFRQSIMKEASYITDASNELIKQIDDTKAALLRVKKLEASGRR